MHDIKHSMCKLKILWNVDDCGVPLHVHFRRGVALVEKFNYWHCSPRRGIPLSDTESIQEDGAH